MSARPRIVIADDEPLLRAELADALSRLWPEAELAGSAADGLEALRLVSTLEPDVAFLDIRMPGMTGLELARALGRRCHVVFVTAHQEHAIDAFDQGAVDYVLKPLDPVRLARCVERVRERLGTAPPDLARLLQQLAPQKMAPSWLQASVGNTIQFVDLDDVFYFNAQEKYTRVVSEGGEAHIRKPLKDLAETLGSTAFWQVHRAFLVAVKRIAAVKRDADGAVWITLRGHGDRIPVSQRYQHLFKGI